MGFNDKMGSMPRKKPTKNRQVTAPAVDEYVSNVPLTKNRMVIVYRRHHAEREYVRLRTFHRHQVQGFWYPARRFYMVPLGYAEQLGNAIITAGNWESFPKPVWYTDFEKQYDARVWEKQDDVREAPQ